MLSIVNPLQNLRSTNPTGRVALIFSQAGSLGDENTSALGESPVRWSSI